MFARQMGMLVSVVGGALAILHFSVLAWDRYGAAAAVFAAVMLFWMFASVWLDVTDVLDRHRWILGCWLACSAVVYVGPVFYFFDRAHRDFLGYMVAPQLVPKTQSAGSGRPLFAMLSDPHITDLESTLEGFEKGPAKLEKMLRRVATLQPHILVISGDLTDRGAVAEWAAFESLLSRTWPGTRRDSPVVVLVPGNHDLQTSPYDDPRRDRVGGYNDPLRARFAYVQQAGGFDGVARQWQGSAMTGAGQAFANAGLDALVSLLSALERKKTFRATASRNPAREGNLHVLYPSRVRGTAGMDRACFRGYLSHDD